MRRTLAGLSVCCLALAGCGGEGKDTKAIQGTVTDFGAALADTDGAKACGLLTDAAMDALVGTTEREACERRVDTASGPDDGLEDLEVTDVEVDGSTATAVVGSGADRDRFRKVDGKWKLDGAP